MIHQDNGTLQCVSLTLTIDDGSTGILIYSLSIVQNKTAENNDSDNSINLLMRKHRGCIRRNNLIIGIQSVHLIQPSDKFPMNRSNSSVGMRNQSLNQQR